jgi:hypothetical protein
MLARVQTQVHLIRLDLYGRWLRRQERAALCRLGREVVRQRRDGEGESLRRLALALAERERRLETLAEECAASLEADRADLARVAPWVGPIVIARGICTRAVLRHRRTATRRALDPDYEALGLAAAGATPCVPADDLGAIQARLDRLSAERTRRLAAHGESAHPVWLRRAGVEAAGLGRAVVGQLRAALVPKLPALAGMAMGWWIANTYTDSHVRSVLRTVGIGSGGTRVVSGSTYKAMNFWLPLLAAAVCAYAAERLAARYRAAPPGSGEPA